MYNELIKWCDENKIIERSEKSFWQCFETYKEEEPEEFKKEFKYGLGKVECKISKITYKQNLPDECGGYVYVTMDILHKGKKVGFVKIFYLYKDGTYFDDYFVLEAFEKMH